MCVVGASCWARSCLALRAVRRVARRSAGRRPAGRCWLGCAVRWRSRLAASWVSWCMTASPFLAVVGCVVRGPLSPAVRAVTIRSGAQDRHRIRLDGEAVPARPPG